MKIVKLVAENFKRITAVEIIPEDNTVLITGKNGQGKSSVLDSIWSALAGGKNQIQEPIRKGQKSAKVTLDLGDLIVTRKWTESGSTLKVEAKDGAVYKSPQAMLDKFIGNLSFNPLEFATMPSKDQVNSLLSVVKLPIDPLQLDIEKKKLFEERTELNRDIKKLEAQVKDIPEVEFIETESVEDLMKQLENAGNVNSGNQKVRNQLEEVRNKYKIATDWVETHEKNIKALEDKVLELQEQIKTGKEYKAKAEADAKALIEQGFELKAKIEALFDVDVADINIKLRQAQANAELKREYEETSKKKTELNQLKEKSNALTLKIEDIEKQKSDALAKAEMPIKGLSFNEEGVFFKDIPLKQCSSAEQLKVSLAVAMSLNPELKVIRITDGSLLDSDNMKIIELMARKYDYQVWIEKVDESGKMGFLIEDGEVKSSNSSKVLFDENNTDTSQLFDEVA